MLFQASHKSWQLSQFYLIASLKLGYHLLKNVLYASMKAI